MYKLQIPSKFLAFFSDTKWIKKVRNFSLLTGESAFDLGVNLIVLIMVERSLGESGLGAFAYLLSVFVFAGVASEAGICRYLESIIATSTRRSVKAEAIEKALLAVSVTSLICMVIFLLTAFYHANLTRVEENWIAYFIIGLTLPLRNVNRIRIAILQGRGHFKTAAALKTWKRVYLLGAVFVLLYLGLLPSLVMSGYLVSELMLLKKSRKSVKLPGLRTILAKKSHIRSTLRQSRGFLLTDEPLEVVLYMDFLILGFFVYSSDLGLYAEASILARIFLLIPSSIKPVFRSQYGGLTPENRLRSAAVSARVATTLLFFINSVLALYILLYYAEIMQSLYLVQGKSMVPFYIFVEILPGLLFFSAVTSQEPVYEVDGKIEYLQKTLLIVVLLNLVLNCFFIPFAGLYGAAFATSGSMFAYFILFGKRLSPVFVLQKTRFIIAGTAVYLTYILFHSLDLSFAVAFFLVPIVLFMLLYSIDFFNIESGYGETQPALVRPETQ